MKTLFRFPQLQYGLILAYLFCALAAYLTIKVSWDFMKKSTWGKIGAIIVAINFGIPSVIGLSSIPINLIRLPVEMVKIQLFTPYDTVVGYVENYSLEAEGAHFRESYTVKGISFSYSSTGVDWYYSTASNEGGAIRGDGQYVEIRYVTGEDGDNKIIYIAEDPEKSTDETERTLMPIT